MVDDPQIQAAIIKETRRGILDTLAMAYPAALTYETLCGVFVETEGRNLKRDLTYLIEKGYVAWSNCVTRMPWTERSYRLTPAGLDIAQKINTDPSLEP